MHFLVSFLFLLIPSFFCWGQTDSSIFVLRALILDKDVQEIIFDANSLSSIYIDLNGKTSDYYSYYSKMMESDLNVYKFYDSDNLKGYFFLEAPLLSAFSNQDDILVAVIVKFKMKSDKSTVHFYTTTTGTEGRLGFNYWKVVCELKKNSNSWQIQTTLKKKITFKPLFDVIH